MKSKKLPSPVVLMILSLITVLFWVMFSIYRVFTTKPTPNVSEEVLKDLDPKLDSLIIREIEKRI